MAERISQYVQAFEELGAGTRSHAARCWRSTGPRCCSSSAPGQTQGFRRTSLHPLGSADDHAYVINDAGITTLIIDPCFAERALALLEKCPGLKQVLTIGPVPDELARRGPRPRRRGSRLRAAPLHGRDLAARPHRLDHLHRRHHGQAEGRRSAPAQVDGDDDPDPARRVGVAGAARGSSCARRSRHAGAAFFVPTRDRGRHAVRAAALRPGRGAARRSRSSGSPRRCWCRACSTRCWTTPTRAPATCRQPGDRLLRRVGDQPGAAGRGDRAVRADLRAVLRPVRGADGDHLPRQGRPRLGDERLASCGRPSAFLRTALLGEDGKPVPPGEPGEICVAGPLLAAGYWKLPDETAETFRDGWLHTGDVAREDEDGFWYIVDRTKDMIVTGGFNVFPREVEDVVAEHPAVAQVGRHRHARREVGRGGHRGRRTPRGRRAHRRRVVAEIQALVKDAQGLGARPQAGDRRRRAAADRARQAGQEGAAGASTGTATAPSV